MEKLTAQEALIYIIVTTSAADAAVSDDELELISEIVARFPVFRGFDRTRLDQLLQNVVLISPMKMESDK